jgi:predicted nucleic acid-binding protein
LVYADDPTCARYAVAHRILSDAFSRHLRACITPQVLCEYYAVVTRRGPGRRHVNPDEALARVRVLEKSRALRTVYPRRGTTGRALAAAARAGLTSNRIYDYFFAYTLPEAGVRRIVTGDAGAFSGLSGLAAENPFG